MAAVYIGPTVPARVNRQYITIYTLIGVTRPSGTSRIVYTTVAFEFRRQEFMVLMNGSTTKAVCRNTVEQLGCLMHTVIYTTALYLLGRCTPPYCIWSLLLVGVDLTMRVKCSVPFIVVRRSCTVATGVLGLGTTTYLMWALRIGVQCMRSVP